MIHCRALPEPAFSTWCTETARTVRHTINYSSSRNGRRTSMLSAVMSTSAPRSRTSSRDVSLVPANAHARVDTPAFKQPGVH